VAVSITVNDATKGVYVAWRLLWRDRGAVSLLDDTLEGVIKSYWCAALLLPFYGIFLLLEGGVSSTSLGNIFVLSQVAGLPSALIAESLFYVIGWWVAWPLVMDRLVPWLGRDDNYFRYIVAYNWAHSVRIGIVIAFMTIRYSGLIPEGMVDITKFAVLGLLCVYHWFLLRNVLEVDGGTAVGLVALEFATIVLVNQTTILAVV
jgi:hypothetical protein